MSGKQTQRCMRLAFVPVFMLALSGCGGNTLKMQEMSALLYQDLERVPTAELLESKRSVVSLSAGMGPAVLEAVAGNEAYQAALFFEEEAAGGIGVADSARFPQLTVNANLGAIREDGAGQSDTTVGGAGGISLSQLVYDGGQSAATVNRATAQALAARADRLATGNELALQAAGAWIDVWQYTERLSRLRERRVELDTLISQIGRMASSGMLDRGAVDSSRRELVNIRLEETGLEGDLQEAQVRFARYFRAEAAGKLMLAELVTITQARAEAESWTRAPGLQKSAADVIAAQTGVASAEAAFRPTARLQAGLTSPLEASESTDTTVGLVFEYTFGDGGKRESQLQVARKGLKAAEAQLANTRSNLVADLDAALVKLRALEQSVPLVADKIRLTTSEAETARSQIVTGQSNLRLLVDAEIENFRARDQQVAMRAEKLKLQLTIAARTGALGNAIGLEAEGSL